MAAGDDAPCPLAVKRHIIHFETSAGATTTFTELFEVPVRYTMDEAAKGLGAGAYGFVAGAFDNKLQKEVAIKKLKNIFSEYDPLKLKSTIREVKLLEHFSKRTDSDDGSHPNILRTHDVFVSIGDVEQERPLLDRIQNFEDIYLVTEKYDMSLKQLIQSGTALGEAQRAYLTFQILRGLMAVFSANVMHRDLKPENVLVNCETCECAICDFGSGRGFDAKVDQGVTAAIFTTTQWYRPPEAFLEDLISGRDCPDTGLANLSGLDGSVSVPTAKVEAAQALDIWSCGAVLAEMMMGKPLCQAAGNDIMGQLRSIFTTIAPLTERDLEPLCLPSPVIKTLEPIMAAGRNADLKKVLTGQKGVDGEEFAPEEIELVSSLMRIQPSERAKCDVALKHAYFTQYDLDEENHGKHNSCERFAFRWADCVRDPLGPRRAIWADCCTFNERLRPRVEELLGKADLFPASAAASPAAPAAPSA